jgi:substrate import-associated zinc metallohydrolase lipoprotein
MKIVKAVLFISSLALFTACKKDESLVVDDIPGLGGDSWEPTLADKYIYDSLTKPFNISVKYKWDPHEVSSQYILRDFVPAKEEVIIPIMESLKKVWADNYIAEKDSLFFKQYAPKFFSLFGSAIYNVSNNTKVLGIAEGGKKINLLEVNEFKTSKMAGYKPSDSVNTKMAFHTTHHEAAHILHQTIMYPLEYKRINVGMYTTNWVNTTDSAAREDGFITAYSMQDPNEDFVEMVSVMLTEGREGFDAILDNIKDTSIKGTTPVVAKYKLRQKETMVVQYFKSVWSIDFYRLQARVRAAVKNYIY